VEVKGGFWSSLAVLIPLNKRSARPPVTHTCSWSPRRFWTTSASSLQAKSVRECGNHKLCGHEPARAIWTWINPWPFLIKQYKFSLRFLNNQEEFKVGEVYQCQTEGGQFLLTILTCHLLMRRRDWLSLWSYLQISSISFLTQMYSDLPGLNGT